MTIPDNRPKESGWYWCRLNGPDGFSPWYPIHTRDMYPKVISHFGADKEAQFATDLLNWQHRTAEYVGPINEPPEPNP